MPTKPVPAGTGLGRSHGVSRAEPFDRWFRYPAGFNRDVLAVCADAVDLRDDFRVVDPFAGAATVGTFAAAKGAHFVGIEAHPLIAELGALKFAPLPHTDVEDAIAATISWTEEPTPIEGEPELVRRSFSDEVLRELVHLRDGIGAGHAGPWAPHLRWALVGTLREVASIKAGWPYQRPALRRAQVVKNATERFAERARRIAKDLESQPSGRGRIIAGDARAGPSWRTLRRSSFDGCISSPPYLNNFDYADATRLELYFLGEASSWSDMCTRHRAGMVVATTQQTSVGKAAEAGATLKVSAPATASAVDLLRGALEAERLKRPRGKEYDRLLVTYFDDIRQVLAQLHSRIRPGGRVAWVVGDSAPYGIFVDTPSLILGLAEETGFAQLDARLVRHRGMRWRTNGSRHQVPLHEKLIVFERPA